MFIANNIKNLREIKNLKQEYIAEKLGISQRAYSKIERGEVDVSFSRLEQIAKVLDINILDLIGFDEAKVFLSISQNKLHSTDSNNQGNKGIVVNTGIPNSEKALYEQIIQQLKEENAFLKKMLEHNNNGS
jgi:transcriptional regulator with XRE-family HTH domain